MTQPLRPWLHIAGLLLIWLASILAGSARADTITYFHNDISGSPVAATDESGRLLWKETYRPYGERLLNGAGPDANRLWFTGKPQDPDTGLSYLGARYYNPQLGRFVGIDPKAVDPADLHGFNRYAYANNNPYKFVDPDGKDAIVVGLLVAITTFMIGDNAMDAYNQHHSVMDEGISEAGVRAAAASVAKDAAIVAGTIAIGGGAAALTARTGVVTETTIEITAAKGGVETVRVGELIATHGKTMSNKQLDKLVKNIRAEGIKEPLTVTEYQGKLYILDGHHRALAAPRAGVAEVPIKRVELPFGAYKTPADLTFTPGGY